MTIYDIARKAGVSIATVSRVLNGGNVKEETRNKVQQVLDTCDYHPSQVAQGLANRQTRRVAVMTLDIRDVHHAAIAYEIERAMADAGYSTVLCNLGSDTTCVENALRGLRGQQFDGVFFIGSVFAMPGVQPLHHPIYHRYSYSAYQCGTAAVQCIRRAWPMKPVPFARQPKNSTTLGGATLPLSWMARPAVSAVSWTVMPALWHSAVCNSPSSGPSARWRAGGLPWSISCWRLPDTDAVLFTEDTTAVGGLQALHSRGITVPDRMAVIGCNNSVYCSICSPQLSSIDNSLHATGRTAARQMIALLNHEPDVEKSIRLPCSLVLRDTTPPML